MKSPGGNQKREVRRNNEEQPNQKPNLPMADLDFPVPYKPKRRYRRRVAN
jgi:hypothetical protein